MVFGVRPWKVMRSGRQSHDVMEALRNKEGRRYIENKSKIADINPIVSVIILCEWTRPI